ncbi:MAG: prephenate dehydrogenase/arogenate dehydrogenase family protein [Verrucomicrobiota bacterium]
MTWPKITLIGVGLLGGSLGLAARERALARHIEGFVRRDSSVIECERLGVVHRATRNLAQAVENADLIVLCTPLAQMKGLAREMCGAIKPGAIITDVGSVKASVVQELEPIFRRAKAHFIGSHPMAGSEKTGASAARSDLFVNAICVVTPSNRADSAAVLAVEELWRAVGGRPLQLDPEEHDEYVSRSSHLPHVVAAELANYVLSPALPKEQALLCANGFRDTTRIASGSPEMWRDIAVANAKNLTRVLGVFIEDLQEFQRALENEDHKLIEEFFRTAKERRDNWQSQNASPSPE